MSASPTVLVVEDEESYVDALQIGLSREGFIVEVARDGAEALARFAEVAPDLVLLDVMLPMLSGIDVCRELRSRSQVPIIMVSAKGEEIDAVVGLEVGADDYVVKPYRMRELVARMRAVLRRRGQRAPGSPATSGGLTGTVADASPTADASPAADGGAVRALAPAAAVASERLVVGDVVLDLARHELTVRGALVAIPRKEFALLEVLLTEAGRVVSRDTLVARVWGYDYVGDTKTLDVHVKRLRAKVETDPSNPTRLVTVRGVGYRYEVPRPS